MKMGRTVSSAAPARPTGALSARAQVLHQVGDHLANGFHRFVSARGSSQVDRAVWTGRAFRSVSFCPSFSKINHIHVPASLKFVLSRKQTNNSEERHSDGQISHD